MNWTVDDGQLTISVIDEDGKERTATHIREGLSDMTDAELDDLSEDVADVMF